MSSTQIESRYSVSLLLFVLLLAFFLSLSLGPTPLPLGKIWFAITHPSSPEGVIFWEIRCPRALLAILCGASLGIAGASLQGLLMNPLADPYVLGMSGGAGLGAVLGFFLGLESIFYGMGIPLMASLGSFFSLLLVIAVARMEREMPLETIILAGVVVGAFLWSLVTLLLSVSGEDAYRILLWLMGSLSNAEWKSLRIAFLPTLAGFVALLSFWRELDAFVLGEETAGYLGVDVKKAKLWIIFFSSLLVASAVSTCGIIGFVGLIAPHIARRLIGIHHRKLLPSAFLVGAILLLLADTLAKLLIAPAELPVGAITALLGAPFFAYLLRQKRFTF